MDCMGYEEGEVIQYFMVIKFIEWVQKKVEENNFGICKWLLEYDDVMNIQWEVIYKKCDNVFFGECFFVDVNNMFESMFENLVVIYWEMGDFESFCCDVFGVLGMDFKMDVIDFKEVLEVEIKECFEKQFDEFYDCKMIQIMDVLMFFFIEKYEEKNQIKWIVILFSDGWIKFMVVIVDLEFVIIFKGEFICWDIEKVVILAIIDECWKEYFWFMDELKEFVQAVFFE